MKKIIIIAILLIMVSFISGYFVATEFVKKCNNIEVKKDNNDTFQAGWEAAKQRLAETGSYYMIDVNNPVLEINGSIKKIENNKITVIIRPFGPLDEPALDERVVIVSNNTTIVQMVEKDDTKFNQEVAEYNQKYKDFLGRASLPAPYPSKLTEKTITISDLRADQVVRVETEDNIREVKEFPAKKITVQFSGNL